MAPTFGTATLAKHRTEKGCGVRDEEPLGRARVRPSRKSLSARCAAKPPFRPPSRVAAVRNGWGWRGPWLRPAGLPARASRPSSSRLPLVAPTVVGGVLDRRGLTVPAHQVKLLSQGVGWLRAAVHP